MLQPTEEQIKLIAKEAYLAAMDAAWEACGTAYVETMNSLKEKYGIFSVVRDSEYEELTIRAQEKLVKIEKNFGSMYPMR